MKLTIKPASRTSQVLFKEFGIWTWKVGSNSVLFSQLHWDDSHTQQFTHLKCIICWLFVYSQSSYIHNHHHNFRTFSSPQSNPIPVGAECFMAWDQRDISYSVVLGPPIIDSRELSKMLIPGPVLPREWDFQYGSGDGTEQDYILKSICGSYAHLASPWANPFCAWTFHDLVKPTHNSEFYF